MDGTVFRRQGANPTYAQPGVTYIMMTYTLPAAEGFAREIDGAPVGLYIIRAPGGTHSCAITNYGARIVSLLIPDSAGRPVDIALGYSTLDGYLQQPEEYMGAIVGRCANRIAAGLFVLNGQTCILPINNGPNTLHGGPKGLHACVWRVLKAADDMLVLTYCSPDGEEGFPGNLDVEVVYQWTEAGTLQIRYHAVTDKPTLVNLSNHTYFNLSGEGAATILDHELQIAADAITSVNETLIPTGTLQPVTGTPFDFGTPMPVGEAVNAADDQLAFGKGYDHNFVLRQDETPAAQLRSPQSGISMSINTDRPGMQFYSGNFLDGSRSGKSGRPYGHRSAVALEPQGFPDAIHHPQFPSVTLKPGEVFYSTSEYRFGNS